jgi:hypothetical protein
VNLKRPVRLDWDALAGVIAATVALILHLLDVISIDVLITIAVVLIALLFIRTLRGEHIAEPEKIMEPIWVLIRESASIIFSGVGSPGSTRALLSFWGEPFMPKAGGREVPRYIFLLESGSELIPRLVGLARDHELRRAQ